MARNRQPYGFSETFPLLASLFMRFPLAGRFCSKECYIAKCSARTELTRQDKKGEVMALVRNRAREEWLDVVAWYGGYKNRLDKVRREGDRIAVASRDTWKERTD